MREGAKARPRGGDGVGTLWEDCWLARLVGYSSPSSPLSLSFRLHPGIKPRNPTGLEFTRGGSGWPRSFTSTLLSQFSSSGITGKFSVM